MKTLYALLCCLLLISCKKDDITSSVTTTTTLEGVLLANQTNNFLLPSRQWQGVPTVEMGKDGILFTSWYSGGAGEGPGNYIIVAVSTDHGATWQNNTLIINPTNPKVRFFDPSLWSDRFGHVYLSWAKSTNGLWDGVGGVWTCQLTYANGTITHTEPKNIANGVMLNKAVDTYDHTAKLYPIAVWNLTGSAKVPNGIYIYRSTYNEITQGTTDLTKVGAVPFDANLLTYDEQQVIQLADGSYFILIRGKDGIYVSTSKDLTSWTKAAKFTGIPATTSSRFFLGRLASGKIALVINNSTDRTNMTVYLSDDETKTWKYGMLLDNKNPVSYPDLTQDADGTIHVVYDYDRYGKKDIFFVSFTENDVMNNATQNISRVLISGN